MAVGRARLLLLSLAATPFVVCVTHAPRQTIPLVRRTFLTGTTPTVDRSHNPAAALLLSKEVGRVTMLWMEPNGVGLYNGLARADPSAKVTRFETMVALGFIPIVTLNPWTVAPGRGIVRNDGSGSADFRDTGFRQRMCDEASRIARRFRPRYFSIGNEVNSVYEQLGAERFAELAALEKDLHRVVKKESPATKVVVVLSYSQLVDVQGEPRFRLVSALRGSYDVLGLTTYPWKRYARPAEMPQNYYSRVTAFTDAPIGFTEIGWSSDERQGGSDEEQVEFLVRFLELTRGMKLEFVNWAFLHDLPESAVTGFVVQRSHLGLGLRRYDGTPKPVWSLFRSLAAMPGP